MALLHEEGDHNQKDKEGTRRKDRYSLEPEKAHPTGEFIMHLSMLSPTQYGDSGDLVGI